MLDYQIVVANDPAQLEQLVRQAMKSDYQPIGGVSITSRPDGVTIYAQALAK